jgi:hypothetical protein
MLSPYPLAEPHSHPAQHHDKLTVVSMAVIASATATLLHEGAGHGLTAWLRGDVPTELTSNHLSALHADRWVDAGGTIVNLAVGAALLLLSHRMKHRANVRYFLWIFAALNLLPGAGYFLYSGIFGVGDWYAFIGGLPHPFLLRAAMAVFGAALYVLVVWWLARAIWPFVTERRSYNTVGRLPYYAAGIFSCMAGAFDPMGLKLFLLATIAAAFGGSSGLLWADSLVPPGNAPDALLVHRQVGWWIAAAILGAAYILVVGPGIRLAQ